MKILLAEDNDEIRDLYTLHLDNIFKDAEVLEAISGNQAIEKLRVNKDVDLIISDYQMSDGNGADLYRWVKKNHKDTPFVLFSSEELQSITELPNFLEDRSKNFYMNKPSKKDDFSSLVRQIVDEHIIKTEEYDSEYKKVRLIYFLRFNKSLCDIYVRINENKHVRIINKNDPYTRQDIYKFLERKRKFLHIKREDFEKFAASLYKTPFLIEDPNLPAEYIVDTATATMEIVHDLVNTLGINERVIKLVDATTKQIERDIKKDKSLFKLLEKFKSRKGYLYDHSYMCGYVCEVLCKDMNWTSDETKMKLSYASILHDVSLTDTVLESQNQNANTLNSDQTKYLQEYHDHPQYVADLVAKSKKLPPNIDTIILQHHENPEGTGFPRKLNAHVVSQLSCVFNVAHTFVTEMYTIEFDESLYNDILVAMKERFSVGNYRLPMQALWKNFFKE